ncbi:trypsin-like peptidase domain-containing protein [Streptomyces sp. NPDC052051]|uniref:VMAP-C domain-containing protein n=1 Tax=Streptomyces sp. NPDC052051 TaxID=3154649 RepID=UPI00341D9A05
MGWFMKAGPSAAADPRHCVVSVLEPVRSQSVGAGVLLTADHLLTCAHVVNDALGRRPFDPRHPGDDAVPVAVHGRARTSTIDARVTHWVPARRRDGAPGVPGAKDHEWLGDLAVLRLESGPRHQMPPPQWLPMAIGQSLRAWHSSGRSHTFADVRVKSCDEAVGYVDGDATGMAIGPSYSGCPLWSLADNAVVGIVAGHVMPPHDPVTGRPLPHSSQHVARRSWSIPWQRIEAELRTVGAGTLFETPEPDPDDPAYEMLEDLLDRYMPASGLRIEHARAVAEHCGYEVHDSLSAPTTEEFTALLLTEPRALAALTEVLHRREPSAVPPLLAAGRMSQVPRLLSPREHHKLTRHLDALPAPLRNRLPEVARAALPLAAALPTGEDVKRLLDHLECLTGDSRTDADGLRVPGLLRVVEYLAALVPSAQQASLRLWTMSVVDRLGIPHTSLLERRTDAEEWARAARGRTAATWVTARVERAGADRYRLRVWCDEGGGPRRTTTDTEATRSGAEVARELLGVLESLYRAAPDRDRPVLELLVGRDELNLAVDEWGMADPEGHQFGPDELPGVLGAEFPVVVTCPELLRRHERFHPDWRHRWRLLDSDALLTFDDPSQGRSEVYGALLAEKDAVRVAVDVPPRSRDEIVQTCLLMGVPVVMWDRERVDRSPALARLSPVPVRTLPEGTRAYRAMRLGSPHQYAGRPVLAWSDADRSLPRLQLAEPQENG